MSSVLPVPPAADSFPLGWANWWFELPAHWRMLEMSGSYAKGMLVLGDERRPRLELAWVWVTRKRLDPEKYVYRFLLRLANSGKNKQPAGPVGTLSLPGFESAVACSGDNRTFGVGYARDTHRILQWVFHHGETRREKCLDAVTGRWRDQPLESPAHWKFFDLNFVMPPGFRLRQAVLNLGDMDLYLVDPARWGTRHRLYVRFVYPASLALTRQAREKWLPDLLKRRKGIYRAKGRATEADFFRGATRVPGVRQTALLHFLLRTIFRPLCFRIPAYSEISLHHLEHRDKLLWLQVAGPRQRIESTRESILCSMVDTNG